MAPLENASLATLIERVRKLETTIETERSHTATKADIESLRTMVERQTRLLIMWGSGALIALFAALVHFLG